MVRIDIGRHHGSLLSALWAAMAAAVAVMGAPPAQAAEPVPLAAFFGPPEIGSVSLSPNGRTLTVTVPGKNRRMELVSADLDQSPLRFKPLAWLSDYDIAGAIWLNDKRLVFQAFDSQAGDWGGLTGLWAVDADGEDARMLIDPYWGGFRAVMPTNRNILPSEWQLHALPGDGSDDVLIAQRERSSFGNPVTTKLARLNTHLPRPQRLSDGAPRGTHRWLVDERGTPEVVQAVAGGQRLIYQRVVHPDGSVSWRELAHFDESGDEGWQPRFVLGGRLFVSSEPAGATGTQLALWDGEAGRVSQPALLVAKGFDVGDNAWPLVEEPGGQPLGWRYRLDTIYTRWADPKMASLQAAIDSAMPGRVNLIQCRACLASARLLVESLSDREPPRYLLLDRASGKLTSLGSAYPEVPPQALGSRSFQRIRARDGSELPVVLTRPASGVAGAGALPAVLYIHGGPRSRVALEWQWDAVPQFLASRGYLVIEPEFRGSAGYGTAHEKAGRRQWGKASQDDMQDALQWAVGQGLADKSRVCIMGASYGGYAALMGPVRYPDAYRCAISWVAPTDLKMLVDEVSDQGAEASRFILELIGPPDTLRETSPVHRVAALAQSRVPVLAAWGVDDQRVPIAHGRSFRDAALAAQVALEYVEYRGEGHVWMKADSRLDFFRRAERMLARSLGAHPSAATGQ